MGRTPVDGSHGPTEHFGWMEFCAGQEARYGYLCAHPELWAAPVRVCEVAEVIRELVGKPVRVTSGLRMPSGSPTSQHEVGQALDIQVGGMTPRQLLRVIRTAAEQGALPHRLRQVIAESLHGTAADLDQPMGKGSGRWVHVAVEGVDGERWSTGARLPWALSWDPPTAQRVYVAAT